MVKQYSYIPTKTAYNYLKQINLWSCDYRNVLTIDELLQQHIIIQWKPNKICSYNNVLHISGVVTYNSNKPGKKTNAWVVS